MANELGNNGAVYIGANAVAEVVDFSWDEGVSIVDNSALGDAADTHLVGTTNAKGSLNCFWDPTDTNGQEAMTVGASVSILFQPQGNTTGDIKYTASATVESVGVAVARNATITKAIGVVVNGAITKGTV